MDYSVIQEIFQQIQEQHDDEWWDYVLNSGKDSPKLSVLEESESNLMNNPDDNNDELSF